MWRPSVRFAGRVAGVVVLLSLFGVAGCGTPTGAVTGTVTYKGQTLGSGVVTFVGKNDQRESSLISPDGTYSIPKAQLGTVKVLVETSPPMLQPEQAGPKDASHVPEPGGGRTMEEQGKYVEIDPKYKDPTTTPLTLQVKKGRQRHDIEMD